MYEFLVLLSTFLVFAVLFFLFQPLLVRTANALTNPFFQRLARSATEEKDDPVLPFEQVIQELQAARRAREAVSGPSMA
ncbi:hypothetical protein [Aliiruegeria lutimaris]|uniref:Uncharacterized protein n=1 Tax=Aliiruegeria lutimaris TaxID=571298 RepID=A0A1G9PQS3_9RHOB|nr:hypothetical protein [Aliiruegeria lutimaris]SDM01114.1 hypothetical protein SAMN04488026_11466 [Aliiruegeria lutimaris]